MQGLQALMQLGLLAALNQPWPTCYTMLLLTMCLMCRSQTIDVFGEIAGISFSPDGSSLFVGVCDPNYSSLLEYRLGPEAGRRHL